MPTPRGSVLVVDDDASVRTSLSTVFSTLGYDVQMAEDGFSALAAIRLKIPDLLISDLNMPGMSGFELLSVVRRRFPRIRVVAMSGAFDGSDGGSGISADAFHRKGGNLISLLNKVEKVIGLTSASIRRVQEEIPLWISDSGNGGTGAATVMLTCPECLRTFPQLLDEADSRVRYTNCRHCLSSVPYAIVQELVPAGIDFGYSRASTVPAEEAIRR